MNKKIKNKLKKSLCDEETVLLADGFEEAFLGIAWQFRTPVAVYDKSLCIKKLMKDMSREEAEEYFDFNVQGAYVGEQTPIFLDNYK
jgi:hypothetical protein